MEIKGRRQTYEVKWTTYGWGYAKAFIVKRKRLLGIIPYNEKIYLSTESPTPLYDAERMHPKKIREWFEEAIRQYDDYLDSWEEEYESRNSKNIETK